MSRLWLVSCDRIFYILRVTIPFIMRVQGTCSLINNIIRGVRLLRFLLLLCIGPGAADSEEGNLLSWNPLRIHGF